jgi:hypothetical protein
VLASLPLVTGKTIALEVNPPTRSTTPRARAKIREESLWIIDLLWEAVGRQSDDI